MSARATADAVRDGFFEADTVAIVEAPHGCDADRDAAFAQQCPDLFKRGLRGGPIYPTWPLIDGVLIPNIDAMLILQPLWRNLFENVLTVQVEHRLMADALWLRVIVHTVDATRTLGRGPALTGALVLALAVTIQAALGILTLIYETPLAPALTHQGMAMVPLTIAVVHADRLVVKQPQTRVSVMTSLSTY